MLDRNFGGIIWTNHALQRLRERNIKQGDAWAVWNRPEQSRYSITQGAWIYYRTYGIDRIEVVAKQNENKEWIILSVWNKYIDTESQQKQRSESLLTRLFQLFRFNYGKKEIW
jgi:hypothetical protein